jgi:hypothetical protein
VHTLKGASPLSSNWVGELVGSKFACVLCQRVIVVARILYTSKSELTTFRACSRHPVPWPCSKSRAHESRRFAQQGHHHGPMCGPHPCLVEEADFIAAPRPGLTPDDLTRGREVGEGLQGFQPKKFRWEKSKERPLSGDRSFDPCLTA